MALISVYHSMTMENLTLNNNKTATQDLFCNRRLLDIYQKIIISSFNIPLSITALLGNILIIVALQRPSCLRPSTKLLFGCLAITDLCVGLIGQPLRVTYLMSLEQSKLCYHVWVLYNTLGLIFCGVSLLTLTAISIDRLLALVLGLRYKHLVTLKRVWVAVVALWLSIIAIVIIIFYNFSISDFVVCTILLLCITISTCCYTKIYFALRKHQAQIQGNAHQTQPNRVCSGQSERSTPLNIARYRKSVSSALWVQFTLLACYLPFGVVIAIFAITGRNTPSIDLAWEITTLFVLLNSSLNPFIYCCKIREVRLAVKKTISRFFHCLKWYYDENF